MSTQEQNTIRQEVLMQNLGVDQLYIDRASGKNADRPELRKMLTYVRQGDTVIVESISRFARNTRDLLDLVEQLTDKQVEFVSQKEAIDTKVHVDHLRGCSGAGAGVHSTTPAGRYCHCQGAGDLQRPEACRAFGTSPGSGPMAGGKDHSSGGYAAA